LTDVPFVSRKVFDQRFHDRVVDRLRAAVGELVSLVGVFQQLGDCGKPCRANVFKIVRTDEDLVEIVDAAPDPGVTPKRIVQEALWKRAHRRSVEPFNTGLEVTPKQEHERRSGGGRSESGKCEKRSNSAAGRSH
jgi:hypothetical protein